MSKSTAASSLMNRLDMIIKQKTATANNRDVSSGNRKSDTSRDLRSEDGSSLKSAERKLTSKINRLENKALLTSYRERNDS